ncbi:MAG: hypothetical protein ACI4MP_14065 [Candidatus Ventricola sp.]
MIFSHHHLYQSWNMNLPHIVSEKNRFVKGRVQKARKKNAQGGEHADTGRKKRKNAKNPEQNREKALTKPWDSG